MSQESVEVVRRGFDAINSGDIERILAFIHPDFEAEVPPELSPEPDTYRGYDGIRHYFASFEASMSEIRFELEQVWDVGETVVVAARVTAKGRETGISVDQCHAQVWTVREGKAQRVRAYASSPDALAAVGLAE